MAKPITNAKCHPNKRHIARGMCKSCYATWYSKTPQRQLYTLKNKDKFKEYVKKYNASEKARARKKAYRTSEQGHKVQRAYHKEQKKNNPNYNLSKLLRARLNKVVKGESKKGSAVSDLGCTIDFLRTYIESLWQPGMSWDNYGEWHLDHDVPLASFDLTNREEFLKANHYSNLQPLWAIDNLSKGAKEMTKINNLQVRIANLKSIGDHLELKVTNTFENQFFKIEGDSIYVRLTLDTAIQLAEFIDREMEELVKEKMGVVV
jgi:hypothetical protein